MICAACGVGKSTIAAALNESNLLENFICIDTDEVGVNWWDYAGTDNEIGFSNDCLSEAVRLSGDKNLIFAACLSPADFYSKLELPQAVTSTCYIGMICSDEEITRRLKARPAERMCGSDEFIAGQIEYNNWIRKNAGKFQFFIDNTNQAVDETIRKIAAFVNSISL